MLDLSLVFVNFSGESHGIANANIRSLEERIRNLELEN